MSCTTTTTLTTAKKKVSEMSPNTARRVRTDLKTSQNVYLAKSSLGPTRSRTSSPITIKSRHLQEQQQHQSKHTPYHQQSAHDVQHHYPQHHAYTSGSPNNIIRGTAALHSGRNIRIATVDRTASATTTATNKAPPTTVASTRRYLRRSNFILTAAKHVVDDSRILSTSAPHEGSSYLRSIFEIAFRFRVYCENSLTHFMYLQWISCNCNSVKCNC